MNPQSRARVVARLLNNRLGIFLALFAAATLSQPQVTRAAEAVRTAPDIEVFSLEECPYCAAAAGFLEELRRERPTLRIEIHDIGADPAARRRLHDLAAAHGEQRPGVPAFLVRGRLIIGFGGASTTGAQIRSLLDDPPALAPSGRAEAAEEGVVVPVLGWVSAERLGLVVFTVVLGLVDGLNPCAMWVLLFVLSLLVNLRDRLRMLAVAGTFVIVSGLAYFAFMAAWLNVFLLPARPGRCSSCSGSSLSDRPAQRQGLRRVPAGPHARHPGGRASPASTRACARSCRPNASAPRCSAPWCSRSWST